VFSDRERNAKASVTLRVRHGALTRDEVAQIARLVAGSVDHLDPKDVVITDADANRTLGGGGSGVPGEGDTLDDQLTQHLIATLSPVVGSDRIRATVNVEEENGTTEENDEKYDPNVSVTLNMQRSEETAGGAAPGGVPGTSSNVPGQKVNASATAATPSSRTESAAYGVNKMTRHVLQPAGGIRRITAAVLLDDAVERHQQNGKWVTSKRKRTPDEIKMINDLAQAAVGFNAGRGDVVTVQNLTFDRADDSDLGPETFIDKLRKALGEYASVIRYVGLLGMFVLVYFLVIRPFQKKALAAVPAPQPAIAAPVAVPPALQVEAVNLAARTKALKSEITEFIKEDPESSAAAVRAWLKEEV
jgi:flagellar M-ring protein FliF